MTVRRIPSAATPTGDTAPSDPAQLAKWVHSTLAERFRIEVPGNERRFFRVKRGSTMVMVRGEIDRLGKPVVILAAPLLLSAPPTYELFEFVAMGWGTQYRPYFLICEREVDGGIDVLLGLSLHGVALTREALLSDVEDMLRIADEQDDKLQKMFGGALAANPDHVVSNHRTIRGSRPGVRVHPILRAFGSPYFLGYAIVIAADVLYGFLRGWHFAGPGLAALAAYIAWDLAAQWGRRRRTMKSKTTMDSHDAHREWDFWSNSDRLT